MTLVRKKRYFGEKRLFFCWIRRRFKSGVLFGEKMFWHNNRHLSDKYKPCELWNIPKITLFLLINYIRWPCWKILEMFLSFLVDLFKQQSGFSKSTSWNGIILSDILWKQNFNWIENSIPTKITLEF